MSDTKKHFYLVMSCACFLLAFLLSMVYLRNQDEALAARLAPDVIRFHVLANSDSAEDQQLKIQVKSYLLEAMSRQLGKDATLEETRNYISEHLGELEQLSEQYMKEQGYSYTAHAQLTDCYFPTKSYGDLVFPSGTYEALRITLGKGAGQNWWCVLYPALCFTAPDQAVVPEESKSRLKTVVPDDDYQSLKETHRVRFSRQRPEVRLWCLEMLQ